MENKYTLDGFSFQNSSDYERAQKEKETIAYLSANTDMTDMKAVYKIYKLSIEKKSFQTVFGLNYLEELRKRLIGSGIVKEEMLEPIPAGRVMMVVKQKEEKEAVKGQEGNYQVLYEKAKAGSMIKNFLIVVLVLVIGIMFYMTSKNQYSILTYFTNYKEDIRNEIVDEMEDWENQLDDKEKELEQREKNLEEQEKKAGQNQ